MYLPECRGCYLCNENRDSLVKELIFACPESSSFLFSFPYLFLFLLIPFIFLHFPFSFPFVFLTLFMYLKHNFLIKLLKNYLHDGKEREKKKTTKQKLKTAWEGMVRVASAIILQAGGVGTSFIVKMEHMDSMVCCHQSVVLIKANIKHNMFLELTNLPSGKSFFFFFNMLRIKDFSVTNLGLFMQSLVM